ncbi:efflux RND transporter periplasmic adaptor subunit [Novosphingobium sp. P6W]|uniref:efflux RND transporter periplasmic adaptor subunit n=1 Tax=Novosphingobium sp. P6W TaxID=1609758 RepID=UPI0005C5D80F|nr:efflux RND transporter periplasmic adaptor subunit [Novosphingobium sp. P6W]
MTNKVSLPALIGLTLLAACSEPKRRDAPPPPTVTVASVAYRSLEGGFTASGRLVPREEVAIAPELSNYRIMSVMVEEDADVHAGQVLAVLDDGLLRSQIAQARATLVQQEVQADRARAEAKRVSGLDDSGVISQEAIDQRRISDRSAAAAVNVAKAQLQDLLTRQARLAVRTPVGGRILQRSVRPGDASSSGQVMFTIARDNLIELAAEVPEASMGSLTIGDPVEVTLADGARLVGQVRLLGARVDERTGLSTARVTLPVQRYLRAGGFARAQFVKPSARVTTVAEAAVHYDADGAYMLLLDQNDTVHRAGVRTGRRAGGMVEVTSGVVPGTRAVMGGSAFVLEGDKVRIAKARADRSGTAGRPGL